MTRRPTTEVMDDLDAAEDAARAAADRARRTMRETKKAELTADFDERAGNAEGEAPRLTLASAAARITKWVRFASSLNGTALVGASRLRAATLLLASLLMAERRERGPPPLLDQRQASGDNPGAGPEGERV